jgi:hypothetical protein
MDVSTTMIYTHVLNRGGRGVKSPLDTLGVMPAEQRRRSVSAYTELDSRAGVAAGFRRKLSDSKDLGRWERRSGASLYRIDHPEIAGHYLFGDRSVRGSTDPSPGARSMDLTHLVVDVGH